MLAASGRVRIGRGLLDLHEDPDVRAGVLHLVEQQLQRRGGVQGVQHPAELQDDLQLRRVNQTGYGADVLVLPAAMPNWPKPAGPAVNAADT